MRRKDKSRLITFLLVALIAGASLLAEHFGWIDEDGRFLPAGDGQASSGKSKQAGDYEVLRGCTLADHRNNDGDSFDIFHGGKRHTLRLYFVDAPEKRRHQYNGKRIGEQAAYFGISDNAAIKTGEEARDFTLAELRRAPFDVSTKWERVFDSERFYAFVSFGNEFLCEQLVERGLARIHTKGADLPDGTPWKEFREHLRSLEGAARAGHRGAWGK
jgi:endonuclease YncB( thermonuclease family)